LDLSSSAYPCASTWFDPLYRHLWIYHHQPILANDIRVARDSKIIYLQAVDSIQFFQLTFGFAGNHLEKFDLDGHNLGTVTFTADHPLCNQADGESAPQG
jgi:hypothetical protein